MKKKLEKLAMQVVPVVVGVIVAGLAFAYGKDLPLIINARRGYDDKNAQ